MAQAARGFAGRSQIAVEVDVDIAVDIAIDIAVAVDIVVAVDVEVGTYTPQPDHLAALSRRAHQ